MCILLWPNCSWRDDMIIGWLSSNVWKFGTTYLGLMARACLSTPRFVVQFFWLKYLSSIVVWFRGAESHIFDNLFAYRYAWKVFDKMSSPYLLSCWYELCSLTWLTYYEPYVQMTARNDKASKCGVSVKKTTWTTIFNHKGF